MVGKKEGGEMKKFYESDFPKIKDGDFRLTLVFDQPHPNFFLTQKILNSILKARWTYEWSQKDPQTGNIFFELSLQENLQWHRRLTALIRDAIKRDSRRKSATGRKMIAEAQEIRSAALKAQQAQAAGK